ncbi:unnamed protein product, partial [Candidula unifasciata]
HNPQLKCGAFCQGHTQCVKNEKRPFCLVHNNPKLFTQGNVRIFLIGQTCQGPSSQ